MKMPTSGAMSALCKVNFPKVSLSAVHPTYSSSKARDIKIGPCASRTSCPHQIRRPSHGRHEHGLRKPTRRPRHVFHVSQKVLLRPRRNPGFVEFRTRLRDGTEEAKRRHAHDRRHRME